MCYNAYCPQKKTSLTFHVQKTSRTPFPYNTQNSALAELLLFLERYSLVPRPSLGEERQAGHETKSGTAKVLTQQFRHVPL